MRYNIVRIKHGYNLKMLKTLLKRKIKKVYESEDFWSVMLDGSEFRSGPFDGGCLTCAKAIIRANSEGVLARIVDTHRKTTHHYGVLVEGAIFDFDGLHESSDKWISTFSENESLERSRLSVEYGYDAGSVIPDDPRAEKEIARLILAA